MHTVAGFCTFVSNLLRRLEGCCRWTRPGESMDALFEGDRVVIVIVLAVVVVEVVLVAIHGTVLLVTTTATTNPLRMLL
jgi:hypothetical protein